MDGNVLTEERTVNAAPEAIFALLADAAQHARFDGSGTVKGTKQASRPLQLGARFGMNMKRGVAYKTANTVIEYEPDRRIAWQTTGFWGLAGGRIWRYELEPADGGTLVRESWDISRDRQRAFLKRSGFPVRVAKDMERTLERLDRAVT